MFATIDGVPVTAKGTATVDGGETYMEGKNLITTTEKDTKSNKSSSKATPTGQTTSMPMSKVAKKVSVQTV